jgi:hypothetical protein
MKMLGRECRLSTLTPISAPLSLILGDNSANPLLHGINAFGLPNQLIDLQSVSIPYFTLTLIRIHISRDFLKKTFIFVKRQLYEKLEVAS